LIKFVCHKFNCGNLPRRRPHSTSDQFGDKLSLMRGLPDEISQRL
jgi:hypothetical protein